MRRGVYRGQGSRGQGAGIYTITGGVNDSREEPKVGQVAVDGSDDRGSNNSDGETRGGKGGSANRGLARGWCQWYGIATGSDSGGNGSETLLTRP